MDRYSEFLPRYKNLRQLGLQLNNRLVETLSQSAINEGAKKLGLLKRNVVHFDTEDEIAVLMDYCLHDVRRQGLNAIEQFLANSPPPPASDEFILLEGLRQARYSVFNVEGTESRLGIHARDLLRDEPHFIFDVGLGTTAQAGLVLAMRVMAPEGIGMSTGAGLPVGVLEPRERTRFLDQIKSNLKGVDFRHPSPEEAGDLAATAIRRCLRQGAAEKVRYANPGEGLPRVHAPEALPPGRVGRNDLCPCGSGKKFKRCCGSAR